MKVLPGNQVYAKESCSTYVDSAIEFIKSNYQKSGNRKREIIGEYIRVFQRYGKETACELIEKHISYQSDNIITNGFSGYGAKASKLKLLQSLATTMKLLWLNPEKGIVSRKVISLTPLDCGQSAAAVPASQIVVKKIKCGSRFYRMRECYN